MIAKILISISGIILLPVLTKTLGAEGYGLWSLAFATITLISTLLNFNLSLSITRLFPGKSFYKIREDFYSILIFIFVIALIISMILYIFPGFLARVVFENNILIVKLIAVIIFVTILDRLFLTVFRAFREIKKRSIIDVIQRYLEVGLAIALVLLGFGVIGAIIALLLVRSMLSIPLFLMIKKKLPYSKPNFSSLKEYLSLGMPAMGAKITHKIVDMSDRYIIGYFLGATFVGYYVPGYSLGLLIPSFLTGGLSFALLPTISSYYENGKKEKAKNILRLCIKMSLIITIPYFIGAILIGESLLSFLTTKEIAQEGYIILVFMSFNGIIYGLYGIYKQVVYLKKRTKLFAGFWTSSAILNLGGNFFLVPRIGIIGAGMTTILSYLLIVILIIFLSSKVFLVKPSYLVIIKIIISSISMGLFIHIISIYIWSNLFFLITIGILSYFIILFIIKGIDKNEIKFIKKTFY